MTERRWCRCGATVAVTGDKATVGAILMWWFQWHSDPAAGHGTATRRQAAKARRRSERALLEREVGS